MERTQEEIAAIDDIRDRLVSGCDAAEFLAMRCPVCGICLKLDTHPHRPCFFVRCIANSVHLAFHAEAVVIPDWWLAHKSGGWLG